MDDSFGRVHTAQTHQGSGDLFGKQGKIFPTGTATDKGNIFFAHHLYCGIIEGLGNRYSVVAGGDPFGGTRIWSLSEKLFSARRILLEPADDQIASFTGKCAIRPLHFNLVRNDVGDSASREFTYCHNTGIDGIDVSADDGLEGRHEMCSCHHRISTTVSSVRASSLWFTSC